MYTWENLTDLYLDDGEPEAKSYYYPPAEPIPPAHLDFVLSVLQECRKAEKKDFRVQVDGIVFRGFAIESLEGTVYQLRKMPSEIWPFSQIGYPERIRHYILNSRHRQGLWIITGSPGSGKSTSTATMISERLKAYGGLAIAIEDPPEMPLQGPHGNKGYCYQVAVDEKSGFSERIKESMRCYPSAAPGILLIGEVRDAETAHLALQSAIDGRLVIATMHASSCSLAIERMVSLAAMNSSEKNARSMLADSIRLVVTQRITNNQQNGNSLEANFLVDTVAAVSIIRDESKPLAHLENEIKFQQRKIQSGDSISVRE